jgi:pyridoxamine 5'-phosphate oxidase
VLQSREQLEAQMAAVVARYEGQDIPRPEAWGGYVVRPERIEFWQGRRSRLHDRLVYEAGAGSWSMVRLSP